MEEFPKGLNEEIVRLISEKKEEPEWMLAWRLKAYATWKSMEEPNWARVEYPKIEYDDIYYYAAPSGPAPKSLDEVDPDLINDVREARHSAERARGSGRRGGGCGVRLRFGRHHLP